MGYGIERIEQGYISISTRGGGGVTIHDCASRETPNDIQTTRSKWRPCCQGKGVWMDSFDNDVAKDGLVGDVSKCTILVRNMQLARMCVLAKRKTGACAFTCRPRRVVDSCSVPWCLTMTWPCSVPWCSTFWDPYSWRDLWYWTFCSEAVVDRLLVPPQRTLAWSIAKFAFR